LSEATIVTVASDNGGRSDVTVSTDLELGGRIAQFGSGVISQVSNRILGQFAKRLNANIAGDVDPVADPAPAARTSRPGPQLQPLLATVVSGIALGLAFGRLAQRCR